MYLAISNGISIVRGQTIGQDQQLDRLCDLEKQFYNVLHDMQRNAQCLTEDFPFALTMLEGMRMMNWYYQKECPGVTPSLVQEKYTRIAKNLCEFTKSIHMTQIHNEGLQQLYAKRYVQFLEVRLECSELQLYNSGLIPFKVDSAK